MTQDQTLDILEKAFEAGCFKEVLKLIRSGSEEILIRKVIEKNKITYKLDNLWQDIFGSD